MAEETETTTAAGETPDDVKTSEAGAAAPADKTTEGADASTETPPPKTLLSDDGGEGDGEGGEDLAWTPPDGIELNEQQQAELDQFTDAARELGLSNAQFNKLIELDLQRGAAAMQTLNEQYVARLGSWEQQAKADAEFGGEALPQNLAVAKQALDAVGTPELSKLLAAPSADNPEGLGLGNHPEVLRLFYRLGKVIGEQPALFGGGTPMDDRPEDRLYPSMKKTAA